MKKKHRFKGQWDGAIRPFIEVFDPVSPPMEAISLDDGGFDIRTSWPRDSVSPLDEGDVILTLFGETVVAKSAAIKEIILEIFELDEE